MAEQHTCLKTVLLGAAILLAPVTFCLLLALLLGLGPFAQQADVAETATSAAPTISGTPLTSPPPSATLTPAPSSTSATPTETAHSGESPLPIVQTPTPTPTPGLTLTPSATPEPFPYLPPSLLGKGSKLGVHGIWSNHIVEFSQTLAQAGTPFRVVKAVDDLGWLQEIKRVSPTTMTIGRLTHEHEGAPRINDPATDVGVYAVELMEPILTKVQNDPALREAVDYWELTNEPLGGGAPADAYARLALVTINALEIAEANDLKLAIFGFSAGTPEWVDLLAITETGVFARARAGGHILTLHEGVFGNDPIIKWWNTHFVDQAGDPTTEQTGTTAPGGWIPGAPVLDGAGALSLRYRFLYHLLEQRDEVLPLFISEFYAGGGYDPLNKADIIRRMMWYDEQIAENDYVWGFAPFTLGPSSGWVHQDYEPFYAGYDGLVAYMIALLTRAP